MSTSFDSLFVILGTIGDIAGPWLGPGKHKIHVSQMMNIIQERPLLRAEHYCLGNNSNTADLLLSSAGEECK